MAIPQEQADKNEAPSWRSKIKADMKEALCQRQEQEAPLLKLHPFLLCAMTVLAKMRPNLGNSVMTLAAMHSWQKNHV